MGKPAEPSFIKAIKAQVGYQEPEGIEAKMRRSEGGEDRDDRDDEAPTIVVLKAGDLSEEEVKKQTNTAENKIDLDGPPPDGKMRFKKPAKRSENDKDDRITSNGEPQKKRSKTLKKSLLSFNEDEEDE